MESLPDREFRRRLSTVRDRIAEAADPAAGLWFGATSIEYLTGFDHVPTERPVALVVTADRVVLVVPRLEVERARRVDRVDAVESYFDYPGGDPIETVAAAVDDLGVDRVLADADGAPGRMGYEGPPLSEFVAVETQSWVDRMRHEKSDAERALIAESARWANLGHRYLADRIEPGAHPATVGQEASAAASRAMLDTLGDRYVPRTRGDGPVHAGFISGPQTALPHGHTANRRLERGDPLITGATAVVDGYRAELERTMFVGDPGDVDDRDRRYFRLAVEAQTVAFEAMGPDVPVADVDRAVWDFFEREGIEDLARHHVGHAIGLGAHEPPYLDRGSDAVVRPGHVYTVEPGVYTDDAGYRHSDTVAVTEDGIERLTYFPRGFEDNVV